MTEEKKDDNSGLPMREDKRQHRVVGEQNAMAVCRYQLSVADQVISELRQQLRHQESLIGLKDGENLTLTKAVADLNEKLNSSRSETAGVTKKLETAQREMEETTAQYQAELEAKEREVEDMLVRQTTVLRELTEEANDTIQQLEKELKDVKENEALYKERISELEEMNRNVKKQLEDCIRDTVQAYDKLSVALQELDINKDANCKLREEMKFLNNYYSRLEDLNKTLKRGMELAADVEKNIKRIKCFLKREHLQRDAVLDVMNKFRDNLIEDIKQLVKQSRPEVVTKHAGSQTEVDKEKGKGDKAVEEGRGNAVRWARLSEEQLKKTLLYVENLTKQNTALKEVISFMRKEREGLEKEQKEVEEARVARLEESVVEIRNNLAQQHEEESVCNILRCVKKEK